MLNSNQGDFDNTISSPSTAQSGSNSRDPSKKLINISVASGALKSSVRQESSSNPNLYQGRMRSGSSRDNSFKIAERSSSIKQPKQSNTPQDELFQAVDTIFGGSTSQSPSVIHNTESVTLSPRSPKVNKLGAGSKDIMSMKGVREVFAYQSCLVNMSYRNL